MNSEGESRKMESSILSLDHRNKKQVPIRNWRRDQDKTVIRHAASVHQPSAGLRRQGGDLLEISILLILRNKSDDRLYKALGTVFQIHAIVQNSMLPAILIKYLQWWWRFFARKGDIVIFCDKFPPPLSPRQFGYLRLRLVILKSCSFRSNNHLWSSVQCNAVVQKIPEFDECCYLLFQALVD